MRPLLGAATAAVAFGFLAACVQQDNAPAHPNPIIIREFNFTTAMVQLDRSFGFSLYRGEPGVPQDQRTAGLGRAVAFNLADAMAEQLTNQGYDVIRSDTATAARAIVVSGSFRYINEGNRRRVGAENSSVSVDAQIEYQAGPNAAPQRLAAFHLDSRQVGSSGYIGASARGGADVKTAAARLGAAIAGYVGDTARLNKWPSVRR
jgi:hypothetical protein